MANSLEQRIVELEQQLARANADKAKYQQFFAASADALSIIDLSSGKFVECNEAAIHMHGAESEANFLTTHPADLSPKFQLGEKNLVLAIGRDISQVLDMQVQLDRAFADSVSL